MSYLLELLGKGLESPLMSLVLPCSQPLSQEQVKLLGELMAGEPAHIANKLRLGIHYAQSGTGKKAEEIFEELICNDPTYIEAYLALASMESAFGDLDKAIAQLKRAEQLHTPDSRVLFGLGYCYERQGQIQKAIKYYSEGGLNRPYLRRNRQRLAAISLVRRNYDETIKHCQILQREHPEDVWNYLVLGQLYLETNRHQEAEASFERALAIEPDNFQMNDDQVETLVKSGCIEEAIDRMQQLIQEQGDFPDSYVRLGDLYSQIGDDEAAVKNYQSVLEIYPGYLEAAVKLGTQHLRMGRLYEAAGEFNQAVEINDRLISAYIGLGLAQYSQGRTAQGEDTIDLAAALEPNTNLLFAEINRLQLKVSQSNGTESDFKNPDCTPGNQTQTKDDLLELQMERFRQAMEKNQNRADLYYHFGLLLRGNGQTDHAMEQFQKALAINPAYFLTQLRLAIALREKGMKKQAHQQIKSAFHLDQEYTDLHYKLGLMYCDKIQFALAVEQFENDLESSQSKDTVQANLSIALQNMGLIDRSAALWKILCELEPQSLMAFQAQRSIIKLKQHLL